MCIYLQQIHIHMNVPYFFLIIFLAAVVTICYLLHSVLSQVHRGYCSVLFHCFTPALALIISSDDLHVHFFLLFIQSAINFIQPTFILYLSVLEFLFVYLKNISTIFRHSRIFSHILPIFSFKISFKLLQVF